MLLALDHVQLTAQRGAEAALRAFYAGVLGMREVEKPAALRSRGGVWFQCGGMQVHFGIDDPPPVNLPSRRHVAFRVSDLDMVRAKLEAAGSVIEEDGAPLPGWRRCYSRDPAGNRVEFLEELNETG